MPAGKALTGGRRRRGPRSCARALERRERTVGGRLLTGRSRWRGLRARWRCHGGRRPLMRAAELRAPRSGPHEPAQAGDNHSAPTHPSPSSHPSRAPPAVAAGLVSTRAATLTVAAPLCPGGSWRRRLRASAAAARCKWLLPLAGRAPGGGRPAGAALLGAHSCDDNVSRLPPCVLVFSDDSSPCPVCPCI